MTKTTFQEQQKSNFDYELSSTPCGNFEKFEGLCNGLKIEIETIFYDVFWQKVKPWNLKILETVPILVKMVHFDRSPL